MSEPAGDPSPARRTLIRPVGLYSDGRMTKQGSGAGWMTEERSRQLGDSRSFDVGNTARGKVD